MSALVVVLPQVWAYAACEVPVEGRKGPMRLVLVGSEEVIAEETAPFVDEPVLLLEEPLVLPEETEAAPAAEVPEELAFYRKYTEGLLRRYVRLSMEAGRTPSLLGRELFRSKVSSYKMRCFDDVVIFVHDVGQCLETLGRGQKNVVRRVAMQEYTQGEVAGLMGVSLRTINSQYGEAIDKLTQLFLKRGLLEPKIACQGGESARELVTY